MKTGRATDSRASDNRGWDAIGVLVRSVWRRKLALQASEARFRGLFESVLEGVFQSASDGRFLLVNPALIEILGYTSADELIGTDVGRDRFLEPADREAYLAGLQGCGEPRRVELQLKRQDGRIVTVLESTRAVHGPDGSILYCQGTIVDITERRHLQERLRQSQKMEAFGQFAGGIAHDFNNLLMAILGYSELALEHVKDQPDVAADIQSIKQAGERAGRLTGQLLTFSRKQVLALRVVDLNHILGDVDKMLRRIIREDITLEIVQAPSLDSTKADLGQMEQVVVNLVVNARDAMPQGGTLTIATANTVLDEEFTRQHPAVVAGRYVSLSVRDTGCGMTPEVLDRVFEPFFTTKGPGEGTGLGLSTVYGIVKQSGGAVTIESAAGAGTTVTAYLPAVDDPLEPAGGAPRPSNATRGTETILLVEDEAVVGDLIQKVLERGGYTVLRANDVGDAIVIEEHHGGPIHMLLSDVVMPGLSGPALAQRIVQRRPAIKVLLASGYATREATELGLRSPNAGFLQKPFNPDTLTTKVRECLDRDLVTGLVHTSG